jgi:hypothetical protein
MARYKYRLCPLRNRNTSSTNQRLPTGGRDDPSHKQKVIYSLTEASIALVPLLAHMGGWGLRHTHAAAFSNCPALSHDHRRGCGSERSPGCLSPAATAPRERAHDTQSPATSCALEVDLGWLDTVDRGVEIRVNGPKPLEQRAVVTGLRR